MYKVLQAATAVGASAAVKSNGVTDYSIEVALKSLAATAISACTIKFQGSSTGLGQNTSITTNPVLAIGTTPERVRNDAFHYRIAGTNYTKAAVVAGSVFTTGHIIGNGSDTLWGVVLIYIDTSGNVSSIVPLATQIYATAALAHTAGDVKQALSDGESTLYLGRILIQSDSSTWTANTDNLTNGNEVTTATFISAQPTFDDLFTHTFSAAELTAQRAKFHITNQGDNYVRLYMPTLTGTGEVDGSIAFNEKRRI